MTTPPLPERDPARWLRLHRPHRSLMTDRPTGRPNPFETTLLLACIVVGVTAVTGYGRPAAFQGVLPPWGQAVWGWLVLIGGIAAVTGLYWPADPVDGVLIKRVGLVVLCPSTIAYGVAGLVTDPAGRVVAAVFAIALGVACGWRVQQVTAAIAGLRSQLRGLREEWDRNDGDTS